MKLAAVPGNFNYPDADSGNAAFPNPARPSPPPRPWRLDLGSPGKRILRRSIKFVFEKGVPLIGLSCVFQPCIRYEVYPVSQFMQKEKNIASPSLSAAKHLGSTVKEHGARIRHALSCSFSFPLCPPHDLRLKIGGLESSSAFSDQYIRRCLTVSHYSNWS